MMAESVATTKAKLNIEMSDLGDLDLNDEVRQKLFGNISNTDPIDLIEKKQKALKGMKKLLDISERYSSYCSDKITKVFDKSEQERVNFMMSRRQCVSNETTINLPYFNGVLKDYQIIGVYWMRTLFEHGVNGILADEMGLGKTVQIIALICDLIKKIKGPFLIVVPLSTIPNWRGEFQRFAPQIPVVVFHGNKQERYDLMRNMLKIYKVGEEIFRPVVVTTLQMILSEVKIFTKITWKYLILDEGHCLKNIETQTSRTMRELKCLNKLILTGTPLQNNLKELWALLNFIMPNIFKNMDTFSSLLLLEDFDDNSKIVKEEQTNNVISSLHKILQPFILRRLKSDVLLDLVPKKEIIVYCPLTTLQRTLYMYTIKKDIAELKGIKDEEKENEAIEGRPKRKCVKNKFYGESDTNYSFDEPDAMEKILGEKIEVEAVRYVSQIKMANSTMMFKRIVNHPYLIHMPVTPQNTMVVDEGLVTESGKMLVLDVMLKKLKNRNHKVLIFSTLVIMLDIIEEYMIMRNYGYCRLDGRRNLVDREKSVKKFNEDPNVFAFLISTRAGGLGLNLIGADTVIIFDRDWNPQVDKQAQDRCHRIGQTKPIMVYSLITKNTIDDRILNISNMKKKLEAAIIKGGKYTNPNAASEELDLKELLNILEKDNSAQIVHENNKIFSDEEWEKLLDRSELYKELEQSS